ncbi:MAG: VCBS repeat-containing protein [Gemmatimonadetes bacterium]|nr:VCBS repeat-containing protein [Gemmatimonadota bacterium]
MVRFSPARLLFLFFVITTVGCAAANPGEQAVAGATPPAVGPYGDFVRHIHAFDIMDETGTPYDFPFLGGLNVPRPQLVDIDADGDLDLFIQESTGRIKFFERTGDPTVPHFEWRSDQFEGLNVGDWYRFVDMDQDGDYDLIGEERFSHIRYYRNDGTPSKASFTLAVDSLRDIEGTPIFSDRQNIPQVTDIDGDGLLDLFIGRLIGTVTRYEEVDRDANDIPRFRLVTDRFEDIEIVAQLGGSLHGANTMAFVDIDLDGDQDFFWGDFFEPGLLFIENTGSSTSPSLAGEPVAFPESDPLQSSGYSAPAFGDVDADGDVDLLVGVLGGAFNPNRTTRDNLFFYERRSDREFTLRTEQFVTTLDVGSESIPAFADLDGDGDQDLVVVNKIDPADMETSIVYRFENVGTAERPRFRLAGTLDLPPAYHYAPAFADIDADGDLDMMLGTWRDKIILYRNDGSPTNARFVLADTMLVQLTRGSNSTPALVDIDADGDLDMFVGEGSGTLNFYRNTGTAQVAEFVLETDRFDGIDVGRRSYPTFVDLDDDGDMDMLVGTEDTGLLLYHNDGSPSEAVFVADSSFFLEVPGLSTAAFVDIDNDGDLDLFVGGVGGGLIYFERR